MNLSQKLILNLVTSDPEKRSTFQYILEREPKFWELYQRLQNGENLLILEVDGPHQESLEYYKTTYEVDDNFIEQDSVQATETNLAILLNEVKHPFGHGYCLAWALAQNY